MFGHNLPDGIYTEIATLGRAYINNDGGKPSVSSEFTPHTVAVALRKPDDQVESMSPEDRAEMNYLKRPFVLIGSSKDISEAYLPDRYTERHQYVDRPFLHGIFDCYTLVRDYYRREFGLWLPANIQRTYGWWESGDNLYVDGAPKYGFRTVEDVRRHDLLVMKFGPVPNHGAIYLGEGKVLHHLGGRFSCVNQLTPHLRQSIAVVYRNDAVQSILASIGDHVIKGAYE
jgi:cell wall-associated NlpC family hydrolase